MRVQVQVRGGRGRVVRREREGRVLLEVGRRGREGGRRRMSEGGRGCGCGMRRGRRGWLCCRYVDVCFVCLCVSCSLPFSFSPSLFLYFSPLYSLYTIHHTPTSPCPNPSTPNSINLNLTNDFFSFLILKKKKKIKQKSNFNLLAAQEKVSQFEGQLRARNSPALYPNHLGSAMRFYHNQNLTPNHHHVRREAGAAS